MDLSAGLSAPTNANGAPEYRGVEIEGVFVEFPFEPYECQREYMAKVIVALKEGKNALLESPTGTGKTLCLLCATLAWRLSLKGYGGNEGTSAATGSTHASGTFPAPALTIGGGSMPAALALIAASHAATASVQAPGAGEGPAINAKQKLPTIIYSSRTHGQLAQVVKELRNTSYRDRVRSTVLASRQQTCLHPTVSKLSGTQANNACKAVVSAKKCHWHSNLKYSRDKGWMAELDGVPDIEELVSFGRSHKLCPFYMSRDICKDADIVFMPYNYLLDANTRKTLVDQVDWDNAVMIFDEAHNVEGVCSESTSFEITSKQLTECMVEAKRTKEVCLEQLEKGSYFDPGQEAEDRSVNYRQLAQDLDLLQKILKMVENGLHGLTEKLPKDGLSRPGAYLFEFFRSFNITADTLPVINTTIDVANSVLREWEIEQGHSEQAMRNHTAALQHLQAGLNLAFSTTDPVSNKPGAPPLHKGYRVHVRMEKSWGQDKLPAPTLAFWCFIPGMAFKMLRHLNLRSIMLTSGTLAPLQSFAAELQLPFDVRLENPHIIKPDQVWVGVLQQGPSGHPLNSSYLNREDVRYKDDLGNAIVNFARLVPDGLLVFFPSYAVLNGAIDHWKGTASIGGTGSTWERIIRHKAPVIEPRDSSLFQQAIDDFRSKLDDPTTGGAVFFAVCRGKVSEGLDFSDRAGRAVIITGIPFANKGDAKVRLKREVLDEDCRAGQNGMCGGGLSGEQWYVQQAMRAVNQAMGRVIRHRWDYGAIILADQRFSTPNTQQSMSKWLQGHINTYPNFGAAAGSLTKFFKEKADFRAPAEYLGGGKQAAARKPQRAGGSVFEVVGGRGNDFGLGGSNSRTLTECAPAAMDVSGLSGISFSTRIAGPTAPALRQQQQPPGLMGLLLRGQGQLKQPRGGGEDDLVAHNDGGGNEPVPLSGSSLDKAAEQAIPAAPATGAGGSLLSGLLGEIGTSASRAAMNDTKSAQQLQQGVRQQPVPSSGFGASYLSYLGAPRGRVHQRSHLALGYESIGNIVGSGAGTSSGLHNQIQHIVGPSKLVEEHARTIVTNRRAALVPEPGNAKAIKSGTSGAVLAGAAERREQGLAENSSSVLEDSNRGSAVSQHHLSSDVVLAAIAEATAAAQAESTAAAAAAAAPQKLNPKEFLDKVRRDLPEEKYRQVKGKLEQYKQSKDVQAFMEGVVEILKGSSTVHLLLGFSNFIPARDRTWFLEVAQTHAAAAAASSQLPNRGETQDPQGPSRATVTGHLSSAQQVPRPLTNGPGNPVGQLHRPLSAPAGPRASVDASRGGLPNPAVRPQALKRSAELEEGHAGYTARAGSSKGFYNGTASSSAVTENLSRQPLQARPSAPQQQQRHGEMGSMGAGGLPRVGTAGTVVQQPSRINGGGETALGREAKKLKGNGAGECCICHKSPMDVPYQSSCSHVACYSCWLKQLAVHFACAVCKKQLRKSNLTKKYFT